jgi:hypothetical protein
VAAVRPSPALAWLEAAEAILAAMADPAGSGPGPPPSTPPSGRARLAELDGDALVAELFEQESTALVRLARLFTDDRNAAEDLVQEAFVRLHHATHRIEDRTRRPPTCARSCSTSRVTTTAAG